MDNISFNIPTMLSIKKASAKTGLSYDFLRKLCLNDQIVYIRAGSKYLINFEKLVDYLNGKPISGGDPE